MFKLTQKQENFCLAYIQTNNASEAYRRAYSASKMKPESVSVEAHKLLNNPKITLRIDALRKPVIEAAQITLEGHLSRLDYLGKKAEADGQYSAAITAETNRGKAAGFYVENMNVTTEVRPTTIILKGVRTNRA